MPALPTPQQVAWQDAEVGMFFHFDLPVFTDLAEGDWHKTGRLDPDLYQPVRLNTDQWMEAAKAIGAKYTVLVAKHCSGFLCWQSDLYPYGVKQSTWRNGQGDVARSYVDSCRKAGLKAGFYASVTANAYLEVDNPGIVNWGRGGDAAKQAAYAKTCEEMLTELWSRYGPLFEVWFDGGALPPSQGGPDLAPILKRLQPRAMVFQGPVATIRWVGNEDGMAGYPCWATVPHLDAAGNGDPDGPIWQPGECDVPVRNHDWFWHPNREHTLYPVDQLVQMYYHSVGRNCNLLLNANINRDGLVPEADMQRYREFGAEIRRRFGRAVAAVEGRGETVELRLGKERRVDHVVAMERIQAGERVREYVVEGQTAGGWRELCRGQSVGHKRIESFPEVAVTALRLRVTRSVAEPLIRRFAAYHAG